MASSPNQPCLSFSHPARPLFPRLQPAGWPPPRPRPQPLPSLAPGSVGPQESCNGSNCWERKELRVSPPLGSAAFALGPLSPLPLGRSPAPTLPWSWSPSSSPFSHPRSLLFSPQSSPPSLVPTMLPTPFPFCQHPFSTWAGRPGALLPLNDALFFRFRPSPGSTTSAASLLSGSLNRPSCGCVRLASTSDHTCVAGWLCMGGFCVGYACA